MKPTAFHSFSRPSAGFFSLLIALVLMVPVAHAAAPDDPVRQRFLGDFSDALEGYLALGDFALTQARSGLRPMPEQWVAELKEVDARLTPHQHTFFPMMNRVWTRESAVFSNLQGARMWLWSISDALKEGAEGVESIDVVDGRVRDELLSSYMGYIDKARSLLTGGEFKGSYFEDTLTPILADYCAYPEGKKQVRPDFADPRIFDDANASPQSLKGGHI